MEKKFEDDELKRLLEKEYIKEAEMLQAALLSEDDGKEYEKTDGEVRASYEKLVERLKADGVYREEEEEAEKGRPEAGTDGISDTGGKVISMPDADGKGGVKKSYQFAKAAGLAIVCALGVFAASMTSEANRNYFIETIRYMTGNDTRVVVSNNTDNEDINADEYKAADTIEKKLDIELPMFLYRPKDFQFYDCEVNEIEKNVCVEYKYRDMIVSLYIDRKNDNGGSRDFSLDGHKVGNSVIGDENIVVTILEIKDSQDIVPSFAAQWERDNSFYQLSGKIEKKELEKIIENMKF